MANLGQLVLVSTPISETGGADEDLKHLLLNAWKKGSVIVVEDEKPARRRWRSWDLPHEAIADFITYNEHSRKENLPKLIDLLKKGRDVYLQSDGGMPGFCDPGRDLIFEAQSKNIRVSCSAFYNSLIPAVAMSGFTEGEFQFLSFPPREKEQRAEFFKKMGHSQVTQAFMDTPYRLERVCEELLKTDWKKGKDQRIYIGMDINREEFSSFWGNMTDLDKLLKTNPPGKREFVCVID